MEADGYVWWTVRDIWTSGVPGLPSAWRGALPSVIPVVGGDPVSCKRRHVRRAQFGEEAVRVGPEKLRP
jgi:hypothetical protein